ncbi:MAG TPA: carboxypeptidase-like regulatory domain-containing protein [Terracidiphilus sp.]|nr:carboxypeptidase-like regulatory domain-containing protein [Terracidiphilus sp.]
MERTTSDGTGDRINEFVVYFVENSGGSPEQVVDAPPASMVCIEESWYYVSTAEASTFRLGKWQKMQLAGPANRRSPGCQRTTPVYDAEGFTVEQPATMTVEIEKEFRVPELRGEVTVPGGNTAGVENAHVEFLRDGSDLILRTITDSSGRFSLSGAQAGRYKFKVARDGFQALRGVVIVDKRAPRSAELHLELYVGV